MSNLKVDAVLKRFHATMTTRGAAAEHISKKIRDASNDDLRWVEARGAVRYQSDDGDLLVSARYFWNVPDSGADVMIHASSDQPGQLIEAMDDLDQLARSVSLKGRVP